MCMSAVPVRWVRRCAWPCSMQVWAVTDAVQTCVRYAAIFAVSAATAAKAGLSNLET